MLNNDDIDNILFKSNTKHEPDNHIRLNLFASKYKSQNNSIINGFRNMNRSILINKPNDLSRKISQISLNRSGFSLNSRTLNIRI